MTASLDKEASTNFDLEQVLPFLLRVSALVQGFPDVEARRVANSISRMKIEEEKEWTFEVVHAGRRVPIRIRVFMDDVDSPDLYFFSTEALATAIDGEMSRYSNEQGP